MKRIIEVIFIYLLGVVFLLTLALKVNQINKESALNTSVASNYTITLPNNYE